jgi:hypothetical protein
MAIAIAQDMDRPSLHSPHNHSRNNSINNEITKASVDDDERVAEVVVADTAVTVGNRTCLS